MMRACTPALTEDFEYCRGHYVGLFYSSRVSVNVTQDYFLQARPTIRLAKTAEGTSFVGA